MKSGIRSTRCNIHLQLMERELNKFKADAADSKWISRPLRKRLP